jgi:hypothetical protein
MPDEKAMGFEDDLHRIDEHLAEARRMVQRQKGLRGRERMDAQRILWLLESNLRRLEEPALSSLRAANPGPPALR